MNKIALCLHGQPRGLGVAAEYQDKNLIKRDDILVDVFFHTWDYSDKIENLNDRILQVYNPKNHVFEKPLEVSAIEKYQVNNASDLSRYSNISHYHSVFHSNRMRKIYEQAYNISYDWVVITRFDTALNIRLKFDELDCSKVYQSDFNKDGYLSNRCKVQNPVFAVGNSKNMDKYASILPNLEELYRTTGDIDGHAIFGANIKLQELLESMEHLDMQHPFPPGGRDASSHSFIRNDFHLFNSFSIQKAQT